MRINDEVGITRIGQVAIPVLDLDRAVAFYGNIVGLKFLFRVPGMAFFECGGVRIMLSAPERPELNPPGSILYFQVPEIDHAYGTMVEKGVQFEQEPHIIARMEKHDLWMAFFRDEDQNIMALMSEVPRD